MNVVERLDEVTCMLMEARKDIRSLRARIEELEKNISVDKPKLRERKKEINYCEISESENETKKPKKVKKRKQKNILCGSSESESESEEDESKKCPKKTKKRKRPIENETKKNNSKKPKKRKQLVDYQGTSESSETEEYDPFKNITLTETETESESEPEANQTFNKGDIFKTLDGICVYLGGNDWGWLYRKSDLPYKQRNKISSSEFVVSDHDYIDLDYDNKTVKKLNKKEAFELSKNIRLDMVYLADSEVISSFEFPKSIEGVIGVLQKAGVQVHFGPAVKNKDCSDHLISVMMDSIDSMEIVPIKAFYGDCTACNLNPKWIKYKVKFGSKEYDVGEICKTRIEIISGLIKVWKDGNAHLFAFKFLESVHALTKLKADASRGAKRYQRI